MLLSEKEIKFLKSHRAYSKYVRNFDEEFYNKWGCCGFLLGGFYWEKTKCGRNYWDNLHNEYMLLD